MTHALARRSTGRTLSEALSQGMSEDRRITDGAAGRAESESDAERSRQHFRSARRTEKVLAYVAIRCHAAGTTAVLL